MKLSGIYAPITTPFDASGALSTQAAGENCRALIAAGLDGIVVAGSTGEAPLLDEAERDALLRSVRDAVGKKTVIMGIGAESTRQTITRAKAAAAAGADAVLVVAPHYFGYAATPDAALKAHYTAVADASPIPVMLYTIPKYMHFALSPSLVAELAQHKNIIGMKDSSGDMTILNGYMPSQSDSFTVITGNGGQFLNGLRAGVRGGILAVSIFAPTLSRTVYDAHTAGNVAAADSAQELLGPPAVEIVGRLGIPGVKHAADLVGLTGGDVRMPLVNLDAAGKARVAALLDAAHIGGVMVMGGS